MIDDIVNPDPSVVTVWSDIGCPWATLALDALRRAMSDADAAIFIDHRVYPLEFFNGIPTPKLILDAEISTIAGLVPDLGWRLWAADPATYPVSMLVPMMAVLAAKDDAAGGLIASDQLDARLRHAFYSESRCISILGIVLELAAECPAVRVDALAAALERGEAVAAVHRDHRLAATSAVQGSPHLFHVGGYNEHNPGATYSWTEGPPAGFPRLHDYDRSWATALVDQTLALSRSTGPNPEIVSVGAQSTPTANHDRSHD